MCLGVFDFSWDPGFVALGQYIAPCLPKEKEARQLRDALGKLGPRPSFRV